MQVYLAFCVWYINLTAVRTRELNSLNKHGYVRLDLYGKRRSMSHF